MKIQLNGIPHELAAPLTVAELLESIGFANKPVVVELNEQALFPRDFANTKIEEASRIEIVTLAAGG